MKELVDPISVDYRRPSFLIPTVMNALYNENASKNITFNEIRDAFRVKQMQSKSWLLEKIIKQNLSLESRILIIGSWIGFTSLCLYKLGFKNITEIDPDVRLEDFSKWLNRENKCFKHISDDVNNIDLSEYDVIINTSCEHILDNFWFDKISNDKLIFLHSNNLEGYDHINICKNLDEMIEKYPLNLLYAGELKFDSYSRFMLIGKK